MERVYVGIGANLGDRAATIAEAVRRIDDLAGTAVRATSALRETEPWGYEAQPRFLNGAVQLDTGLTPRELLDALLEIERTLGRTRTGPRYGPRTIDLDLLLYGDVRLDEEGLTLPHPRLHERSFALEPLLELDPDLVVPGRGRVADLLASLHSDA